jgi:phage gpG-like protein
VGTIVFKVDGLESFALTLARFQENISDAAPAFEAMADHQAAVNTKQFTSRGAYGSGGWAPLSPQYAAWKARHYPGKGTLELSGDLRDSLTKRPFGIDVVKSDGMVIGTGVPYAPFHQKGTDTMPARPVFGDPQSADTKVFAKILQSWIVKGSVSV